jgi:hypothetical protein
VAGLQSACRTSADRSSWSGVEQGGGDRVNRIVWPKHPSELHACLACARGCQKLSVELSPIPNRSTGVGSFGKKVGNVVRTTKFEQDEVINLILAWCMTRDAVLCIDLALYRIGNIADRSAVAGHADLGGGGIGEDRARRAGGIGEAVYGNAA